MSMRVITILKIRCSKGVSSLLKKSILSDMNMEMEILIKRWKLIASAVFWAENRIIADWRPRLEKARKENSKEVADAYLEAIAKEIIDNCQMKFEDE